MPRFVQADLASAWNPDPCHQAVPLVGDRRDALDALLAQLGDRSFKVVAHEKEFVLPDHPPPARARMDGELGRRQREDQPALARIDPGESEDDAQERARRVGVLGEENRVCARYHNEILITSALPSQPGLEAGCSGSSGHVLWVESLLDLDEAVSKLAR